MRQRLRMTGSAKQRMEMRCSSCKQVIGGPTRDAATNVDANLFGAEEYVVCPTCNQVVPEELRTPTYKSVRAGHKSDSPKDVAEWMYEQVNQKAVLWQAYAVVAIADRFGKSFIDNDKSGEPVVSQIVLAEFRRLSSDAVIWDEDLAQWRLR